MFIHVSHRGYNHRTTSVPMMSHVQHTLCDTSVHLMCDVCSSVCRIGSTYNVIQVLHAVIHAEWRCTHVLHIGTGTLFNFKYILAENSYFDSM
jgi:hypothetical protein